jgi:hypothetical protein
MVLKPAGALFAIAEKWKFQLTIRGISISLLFQEKMAEGRMRQSLDFLFLFYQEKRKIA